MIYTGWRGKAKNSHQQLPCCPDEKLQLTQERGWLPGAWASPSPQSPDWSPEWKSRTASSPVKDALGWELAGPGTNSQMRTRTVVSGRAEEQGHLRSLPSSTPLPQGRASLELTHHQSGSQVLPASSLSFESQAGQRCSCPKGRNNNAYDMYIK